MADKKSQLLGMNSSTASSALRKQIIFHLAGVLGLTRCFQCGKLIEELKDFSIEHKQPWMSAENPVEAFFDMNNIAFSHQSCNSGAGTGGGEANRAKTHCPSEHPYDADNTLVLASGERRCKVCDTTRKSTPYWRKKQREYNSRFQSS